MNFRIRFGERADLVQREENNMGIIKVYGSCGALVSQNEDNANYLVDDIIKIDLGSHSLKSMLDNGVDITKIKAFLFTHMHSDHTLNLPALLFHFWVKTGSVSSLRLLGPKGELKKRYNAAYDYAFYDWQELRANKAFGEAKLFELEGGEELDFGTHTVKPIKAYHTVPALAYRITEKATAHSVCFTGDTEYNEKMSAAFSKSQLIVSECNNGLDVNCDNSAKHQNCLDATKLLNNSGSERMLLTHISYPDKRHTLEECRRHSDKPIDLAMFGNTYEY